MLKNEVTLYNKLKHCSNLEGVPRADPGHSGKTTCLYQLESCLMFPRAEAGSWEDGVLGFLAYTAGPILQAWMSR